MNTQDESTSGTRESPQLPPAVAEVYGVLFHQLVWARYRWQAYSTLFNHSQRRIDLLNESASFFFFLTQETLFDGVHLALVRMTDPASSGRYKNATLERLHAAVKEHVEISAVLIRRHDEIESHTTPLRKYRDKLLAHLDLPHAVHAAAHASIDFPLPLADDIEKLLTLWADYLNEVKLSFGGVPTAFEDACVDSDASALVGLLKQGHRYEALLMAETIDPHDDPEGVWAGA